MLVNFNTGLTAVKASCGCSSQCLFTSYAFHITTMSICEDGEFRKAEKWEIENCVCYSLPLTNFYLFVVRLSWDLLWLNTVRGQQNYNAVNNNKWQVIRLVILVNCLDKIDMNVQVLSTCVKVDKAMVFHIKWRIYF